MVGTLDLDDSRAEYSLATEGSLRTTGRCLPDMELNRNRSE